MLPNGPILKTQRHAAAIPSSTNIVTSTMIQPQQNARFCFLRCLSSHESLQGCQSAFCALSLLLVAPVSGSAYVCFIGGLSFVFGASLLSVLLLLTPVSSSMWMAIENLRQNAGSRTPAIVVWVLLGCLEVDSWVLFTSVFLSPMSTCTFGRGTGRGTNRIMLLASS